MLLGRNYPKQPKIYAPNYKDLYEDKYEDLRGIAEAKELKYLGCEKVFNPNDSTDVPMEWEAYFDRISVYAAKRTR